jgi:membrane protein EpsK
VALALWSGLGYLGIALAGAIVLTAKNTLFTPLYAARNLKLPWHTFLPSLIAGVIGCVLVAAGAYWASSTWILTSWSKLALAGMSISLLYIGAAILFGLGRDDRTLLVAEIRRRLTG